jgi:hypothetical protein
MASEYDFESFPSGWEDSSIVSAVKENSNGSITVRIQINVVSDDGRTWETFREIRLQEVEHA